MKALVTGGSGFIGSHVVDKLRDRGIEVRVFDMCMPSFRRDIEYYQGSLLDFDAVKWSLSGVDVVFHLGAVADVKDAYEDPYYAESINVRGTINILEAARRSQRIKRVVYGSTTWVYSETDGECLDETVALHAPTHIYTATKMAGEYYCTAYRKLYNLETTILRYGIPYGPRARDGAVIPIFVKKALNGEPLTIAGDGSQYRKSVYVEDLAEGNVLALKSVAKNKVYNLEGKEKVTIRQIAETIGGIVGGTKIEYVPTRPGDFSGKEISAELAKRELGWEARTPFAEGVKKYIEWFKAREAKKSAEWEKLDKTLSSDMEK